MAIVSLRIYCDECDNEEVIREDYMDDSVWKINSKVSHSGVCPLCNDAVDLSELDDSDSYEHSLDVSELDGIGAKAAQNLTEAGFDTEQAIINADDDALLDVAWVGEKALFSLKKATNQLDPQERWDE